LKRLSKHYQTGESLSDALIDALVKSKLVNAGLVNLRQLFFGQFDMAIHSGRAGPDNLSQVYEQLRAKITRLPQQPGLFPLATFGHLMGGCTYIIVTFYNLIILPLL
jgi:Zn-dependent oligopeptidase